MVICSASKVPFTLDLSQRNLHLLYGIGGEGYVWIFREMLQIEDQTLLTRHFVPQVTNPLFYTACNPAAYSLCSMHGECKFRSFRKNTRMEAEPQPKRYFVLNCPWLLTDQNQTDILCRAFAERKISQTKPRRDFVQ
jgi:hypothetical protein